MDELVAIDEPVIRKTVPVAEIELCNDREAEADGETEIDGLLLLLPENKAEDVSETVVETQLEYEGSIVSDNEAFAERLSVETVDGDVEAPKEREAVLDGVTDFVIFIVEVKTAEAELTQLNVPDDDGDTPRVTESRIEILAFADTEAVDDTIPVTVGFSPVADVLELPDPDDDTEGESLRIAVTVDDVDGVSVVEEMAECESASEALLELVAEPQAVAVCVGVLVKNAVIDFTLDKDT